MRFNMNLSLVICGTFLLVVLVLGEEANSKESKKQVIVVSVPGDHDTRYADHLQSIADFAVEMDGKTKGRDYLFIVHDKTAFKYFKNHNFTNSHLIQVNQSLDMWMKDFSPCMPKLQVKFKYRPQYMCEGKAILDEAGFEKFASHVKLPALTRNSLVMEGGNVVENGVDSAVVSENIYSDNKHLSQEDVVAKLGAALKRKIVVIYRPTADKRYTTEHADGVVSFVEEDILLLALYQDRNGRDYYKAVKEIINEAIPKVTVVPLPCDESFGFGSAEGSYANSLVTYNAVYLPFFTNGQASNQRAYDTFRNHSNKDIVPVYSAGKVRVLKGSLRRMTWQIDQQHPVAKRLFAFVEEQKNVNSGCSAKASLFSFLLIFFALLLHV